MKNLNLLSIIFGLCLLINSQSLFAQSNSVPADDYEPYIVELDAVEFGFNVPKKIKSGWVTFRFSNEGALTHVTQIIKLEEKLSKTELDSIFQNNGYPATKTMGGPGLHSPGQQSDITLHLEPGHYALFCGTRMKNDVAHSELGMVAPLEVTEEIGNASPPQADYSIDLNKYEVATKGSLNTGNQTIQVEGNQVAFDVHLVPLDSINSPEIAFNYFYDLQDPTDAVFETGVEEGHTTYITTDIKPGTYMWSSQEFGVWGMNKKFTLDENGYHEHPKPTVDQKLSISTSGRQISISNIDDLSNGRSLLTSKNNGDEVHQLEIWQMQPGKTKEDFLGWMRDTQKDHEAGHHDHTTAFPALGYGGIKFEKILPGEEDSLTVTLNPGTYIATCYTYTDDGIPHIQEGEIIEFEIN